MCLRSIAAPAYIITAHHLCAFLMYLARLLCVGFQQKKNQNWRASDMNACCIFGPIKSLEATRAVGCSQVWFPTRAGAVFVLLLSVDNVKR